MRAIGPALVIAASVATSSIPAEATDGLLSGHFVVVAFREVTDPEFPELQDIIDQDWIGRAVDFDDISYWFDDDPCPVAELSLSDERFLDLDDPVLSDLLLSYSNAADMPRDTRSMWLDCGGRAISSAKLIVELDDRILLTTTYESNTIAVLERPLGEHEALELEETLSAIGYDPGQIDGVIDGATRNAVAALALEKGAMSGPEVGVITQSLLSFLASQR